MNTSSELQNSSDLHSIFLSIVTIGLIVNWWGYSHEDLHALFDYTNYGKYYGPQY